MVSNLNETELARLEALAAGATTLPWKGDGHKECGYGWVKIPGFNTTGTERSARLGQYLGADDDANYIAAACNNAPALIAEIRRLRAEAKQGGIDYCALMDRHDAQFVRAEKLREKVEAWEWCNQVQHIYDNIAFVLGLRQCAINELYTTLTAAREAVHADRE